MGPSSYSFCRKRCTFSSCRGSVVRMKSSLAMLTVCNNGNQALDTSLSAHSWGVTPFAVAVRRIFWPCSSVPARQDIGGHLRVRMPDVWHIIDVEDGRGDIEGRAISHALNPMGATGI